MRHPSVPPSSVVLIFTSPSFAPHQRLTGQRRQRLTANVWSPALHCPLPLLPAAIVDIVPLNPFCTAPVTVLNGCFQRSICLPILSLVPQPRFSFSVLCDCVCTESSVGKSPNVWLVRWLFRPCVILWCVCWHALKVCQRVVSDGLWWLFGAGEYLCGGVDRTDYVRVKRKDRKGVDKTGGKAYPQICRGMIILCIFLGDWFIL